MSHPGFMLVTLRLTGKDVSNAEVWFKKGLNVICGPSDTGKTFIFQCINFVLGGKDKPKEIDEAAAYDTIFLTIASYSDGKQIILKRSIFGGDIEVAPDGEDPFVLAAQHSKDRNDTISCLLLKLSNLENKWIKKNANGVKQSLSFRNIVHLCMISEEQVIKETSPVFTGHRTSKTAELSVFKLILSGIDDSSIVEAVPDKISKVRVESKNEIIQKLMSSVAKEFDELNVAGSYEDLNMQLEKIEQDHKRITSILDKAQDSVMKMEKVRNTSWEKLRQVESRLNVLSELKSRFKILEKQYMSDLRRLDAIAETGGRLTEMNHDRCAVCGSLAEFHESKYQNALVNPEAVYKSCIAEAIKLRSFLIDLKITQSDVDVEISEKLNVRVEFESNLESINNEVERDLKPKLKRIVNEYREGCQKQYFIKKAIGLLDRLAEYKSLIEEVAIKGSFEVQTTVSHILHGKEIEYFSLEVERRLDSWNFPNSGRVTFSEADWDIMIAGRRRASHGKGVRAITHAAFSLGLLAYCKNKSMGYPNFVMIDSPLIVYREPDPSDLKMALDVKNSFYKDVSASYSNVQVIVLENEDPPAELIGSEGFNLIAFSKTNVGRYGFIPIAKDSVE